LWTTIFFVAAGKVNKGRALTLIEEFDEGRRRPALGKVANWISEQRLGRLDEGVSYCSFSALGT